MHNPHWQRRMAFGVRLLGSWLLWSLLAGTAPATLAVGLFAAVLSTLLSLHLLPPGSVVPRLSLLKPLPNFVWQSILGSIDVTWRALAPKQRVHAGWQRIVAPDHVIGRYVLGCEITLMPGTLLAGMDTTHYLVHLLDRHQDIGEIIGPEGRRLERAGWMPVLPSKGGAA